MKILFVLSRDVMFFHGSGEVEAKILQIGFQLLGIQCDTAGLDSVDFYDYDAYLLFSIRPDIIELLGKIPANKPCILVPQTDCMDENTSMSILAKSKHLARFVILCRSEHELARLSPTFGASNIMKVDSWFLKPFVHEEKLPDETDKMNDGYILCMLSADRDEGLLELVATASKSMLRLYVISDRPEDHDDGISQLDNVIIKRRVPYGSLDWYILLDNSGIFYEPNPRVTCSTLEALWLEKVVISPYASYLNSVLGKDLIWPIDGIFADAPGSDNSEDVRELIYKYHANFVAGQLLVRLEGTMHA